MRIIYGVFLIDLQGIILLGNLRFRLRGQVKYDMI